MLIVMTSLLDSCGAGIRSLETGLQGCPPNSNADLAIAWLRRVYQLSVLMLTLHTKPVSSGARRVHGLAGCFVLLAGLGRFSVPLWFQEALLISHVWWL